SWEQDGVHASSSPSRPTSSRPQEPTFQLSSTKRRNSTSNISDRHGRPNSQHPRGRLANVTRLQRPGRHIETRRSATYLKDAPKRCVLDDFNECASQPRRGQMARISARTSDGALAQTATAARVHAIGRSSSLKYVPGFAYILVLYIAGKYTFPDPR